MLLSKSKQRSTSKSSAHKCSAHLVEQPFGRGAVESALAVLGRESARHAAARAAAAQRLCVGAAAGAAGSGVLRLARLAAALVPAGLAAGAAGEGIEGRVATGLDTRQQVGNDLRACGDGEWMKMRESKGREYWFVKDICEIG